MDERRNRRKIPIPPALKLLVRGYMIIVFIFLLDFFGVLNHLGVIIFSITIMSISMMFGVSYLLMMSSRPVRKNPADIPVTLLFFAAGSLAMYFVSLAAEFGVIMEEFAAIALAAMAMVMVTVGVASYIFEVMHRSRPLANHRLKSAKARRHRV